MPAREKGRIEAQGAQEFYQTAARLYAAGVGLYCIVTLMWQAWDRLSREHEQGHPIRLPSQSR